MFITPLLNNGTELLESDIVNMEKEDKKELQNKTEELNPDIGRYYEVDVNPWDTSHDVMKNLMQQALHGKAKKMTEKDFEPKKKVTREEIYKECIQKVSQTNCLLLELPTGYGKSKVSIDLTNYLLESRWYENAKEINILLVVAKIVHKQAWKEEIAKWGNIKHSKAKVNICMECYESLHKHCDKTYDFILLDEVHHVGSEMRMQQLKTVKYGYMIGLSATIPQKLKQWFKYNFHSETVSCDIIEAIDSEVLPEPTIMLFPLQVENTRMSETIEINKPKKIKMLDTWVDKKDPNVVYGEYKDLWKYKKSKQHAILRCTQKQKLIEFDRLIEWYKKKAMSGNMAMKQSWLYLCGKRLEFLADCKMQWVKLILHHLDKERTITFCKTIAQTEQLGKNCIHSQNKDATKVYDDFNNKKIDHITAVNILNENANLVDCRYGIFCNITSSEIITQQRQGRLLRHKDPIMVIPYYVGTREEELVKKGIEGFKSVKTIHSINEI